MFNWFSKTGILQAVHFKKVYLLYKTICVVNITNDKGARRSSMVRAFAHAAMGRRIDPSWGGPIELFLVPASAPRLV